MATMALPGGTSLGERGRARRLPPSREGDVLLIGNAGAYGRVMSSEYNLRPPAREVLLPARPGVS